MVVVILGMHRSGTSLVANILHSAGVHMGDIFRLPDAYNRGYYEDLDWRAINKWILNTAGGTWFDPPSYRQIVDATARIGPVITVLVEQKNRRVTWGFKDPRTCLTIQGLHPYLPNPRYIVVKRNKEDVIASLQRRATGRGYEESYYHWSNLFDTYITRVQSFLDREKPPVLTVNYEDLVQRESAGPVVRNLYMFSGVIARFDAGLDLIRFRSPNLD